MCGIAGYISTRPTDGLEAIIQGMTDRVAHRGPDGQGIWCANGVALGHRRLSILDLSEMGHQPMAHSETGCVITFNGEIYNYLEIRTNLIAQGYQFRSNTDTEVILKAYDRWGTACVERFNGMWSFAIFDPKKSIVFCSRDRFGVKPFYYADTPGGFAFGSEIRQLLPLLPRVEADARVLLGFLVSRVAEDQSDSFFRGVHKLPGGHNLIFDLASRRYSVRRHYRLEFNREYAAQPTGTAAETLHALLEDAIRLRLRSDVKVGTCLSGGLDSSTIATLAAPKYGQDGGGKFSAITAVSEDPATDESHFARRIVERSGLEWITVKPTYADFCDALNSVVRAQEEPFASASVIMQYYVMKESRRSGIPVLLDGQGADETLLGYERYFADYVALLVRARRFRAAAGVIAGLRRNGRPGALRALARNLLYFHAPRIRKLVVGGQHRIFKPEYMSRVATGGGAERVYGDFFEMQKVEIEQTNLPVLLRYEDKNSMWHSIETRLPFLDYRLVEFCTSVGAAGKLGEGWGKFLLRKAMTTEMPAEITWRKNKFGFEAPESQWTAQHDAHIRAAILHSPLLKDICADGELSNERIDRLNPGIRWRLFSTALWAREFNVTAVV